MAIVQDKFSAAGSSASVQDSLNMIFDQVSSIVARLMEIEQGPVPSAEIKAPHYGVEAAICAIREQVSALGEISTRLSGRIGQL